MNEVKLTVFTEPIAVPGWTGWIKAKLRPMKFYLKGQQPDVQKKYGGHPAVTRSLVEGLKKCRIAFNYNPHRPNDIFENVIVLAGVERLRQMIRLKRQRSIKLLFTGPNVVEDVRDEDSIVCDKAIDAYIVPSPWVADLATTDCPDLKGRVRSWPAGIDIDFWKRDGSQPKKKNVLIYWKSEPGEFVQTVQSVIQSHGFTTSILKYGDYEMTEYRQRLNDCELMVFISRSESQGIALFEAWAMDVPTFVFDPGKFSFGGRIITNVSSCPYLVPQAGATWRSPDELAALLGKGDRITGYSPRKYVLNGFTDEQSASRLIELVNEARESTGIPQ